ncbi:hypothetical protein Krac_0707 [Ktedonobacter racemifer DSM 44963]|uniref:Uncharacterized protein n=1 Tax=Ktedonobacter racemifer DSM 44963 TaxID=485913 RepID=D6U8D5_KTERA|nr:hypothetical protein Krac_0707 [Ktedonobacter racemifer DSM 44963]
MTVDILSDYEQLFLLDDDAMAWKSAVVRRRRSTVACTLWRFLPLLQISRTCLLLRNCKVALS